MAKRRLRARRPFVRRESNRGIRAVNAPARAVNFHSQVPVDVAASIEIGKVGTDLIVVRLVVAEGVLNQDGRVRTSGN